MFTCFAATSIRSFCCSSLLQHQSKRMIQNKAIKDSRLHP